MKGLFCQLMNWKLLSLYSEVNKEFKVMWMYRNKLVSFPNNGWSEIKKEENKKKNYFNPEELQKVVWERCIKRRKWVGDIQRQMKSGNGWCKLYRKQRNSMPHKEYEK